MEKWGIGVLDLLKIPNPKSQTNGNDQNAKFQTCFGHLVLALWNFALGEPAEGRIPQGENLRFVRNLVLGVWDFTGSNTPENNRRYLPGYVLNP